MSKKTDEQAYADYLAYQEYLASQEGGGEGPATQAAQEAEGALDKGLKVLDYQRAKTGGPAIAKALEKLTGKKVLKDGENASRGNFPGTAEMMKRAGVLTEPVLAEGQEPGLRETRFNPFNMAGNVASEFIANNKDLARNVLGIGADIASDPMTYESGAASALARFAPASKLARGANAFLNPLEEFFKMREAKNYKNAFRELDHFSSKLDKPQTPSSILQEQGFVGGHEKAASTIEGLNKKAGEQIGANLDEAAAKGATVHPLDLFQSIVPELDRLRSLGLKKADDLAKSIEAHVAKLWMDHPGAIPVDKANEAKTFLDKQIKTAGHMAGDEASLMKQAEQEVANTIRAQSPAAIEKVDKPLAEQLRSAMKRFASTDKNVSEQAMTLGRTKPELRGPFNITQVDAALAGAGGLNAFQNDGDLFENPFMAVLLAKKFGQAAMSTPGRTFRGAMAGKLARTPMLDPLARQAPRTVWGAMSGEEE